MAHPYVTLVSLKPESGQGDPGGYVLVGSGADLRTVLEDLLAALGRFEAQPGDGTARFHAIRLGDASARHDYTYLGVRVDPDVSHHRRVMRRLWRLYDSQLAGLAALVLMLLAIVGARTTWLWLFGR